MMYKYIMSVECNLNENALNITTNCDVNGLGTIVRQPCVAVCLGAVNYAILYCLPYYNDQKLISKLLGIVYYCAMVSSGTDVVTQH